MADPSYLDEYVKELQRLGLIRGPEQLAIPVIVKIDAVILAAIKNGGKLDMTSWHDGDACGTKHCRAGWAVHCAGEPGRALEARLGPRHAGALIYLVSRPGLNYPKFFVPGYKAIADIKKCAAEQMKA